NCHFGFNRFVRARSLRTPNPGHCVSGWGPEQCEFFKERSTMRRFIQVALLTLSWVLVASLAQAQRLDGTLRVTVTDKTGGTVEGARVTVTNEATNVSTTATASSAGTYVFPSLLVGSYRVTVEKDGFKKSVSKGVAVESNQVAEATALLEIGDVSAVVEVEAGAGGGKVESSELSAPC